MSQHWPADKVERRPLSSLTLYPENARTHSDAQISQIAASMQQWGWTIPILVDEAGVIIAGHGRFMAAKELGLAEVPVMTAAGWTDAQKRAYRLADNQLTINSGWDKDLLGVELGALQGMDFDLELLGFPDLDQLLGSSGTGLTDPDEAPEPPQVPVSRLGDCWILGQHRLVCGDNGSLDAVANTLIGHQADLIVTSPPYNQKIDRFAPSGMHKEGHWVEKVARLAYCDDLPEPVYQRQQKQSIELWHSLIKEGRSFFYNHKNRYREKKTISPLEWLPGPFSFRQEIIWRRPGSVTQNARMFLPCDERIYWLYKGDDFIFNDTTEIKTWSTVWDISPRSNLTHAVAFPVEIPQRCILACTQKDGLIFDPYVGSGTTIIAAEMTGRACHAIEIDPRYCDVSIMRWQNFTGKTAIRETDGREFQPMIPSNKEVA